MYVIHNSNQITGIKPTTAMFNAVINAFVKNMKVNKVKCAAQAGELLNEMMQRSADSKINVDANSNVFDCIKESIFEFFDIPILPI